jgi:hypothetical protein
MRRAQERSFSPMAEEGQIIRGIDWRQAFPFTNIFRSFRIAIHLSKLLLGLALLLSIYFGGRIMDGVWPTRARALPGEIGEYESIMNGTDQTSLTAWREQTRASLDEAYAQTLITYQIIPQGTTESNDAYHARVMESARKAEDLDKVKQKIIDERDANVEAAKKQYTDLGKRNQAIADAYKAAESQWEDVKQVEGQGLFSTFFQSEITHVSGVVDGVKDGNWLGAGGVKDHLYEFFAVGPLWLIWNHTVFFVIFAVLYLLSWALFGGAISRIAAVHVARDEKISLRQAMNFAVGKLLSFASAPVIPLAIIIVIGLIVAIGSIIGNIPFLGPIVVGALFFIALLAGFVMTLVLLGTAGGFNLMYPTIAVEGSDSFDAISRSFSYVYARPWRMLFYSLVALAYGAATYLFVRMFIWLTLVLTHHFVGMGMFVGANNGTYLLDAMWPGPTNTGRLSFSADYQALSAGQSIGAFFVNCWVMLFVSFLGAFAISLYFSANTIIYYLMRSEVDSTELDDVYLEQSEEELEPALSAVTAKVTTETTVITESPAGTPAPDAPPAPPPPQM